MAPSNNTSHTAWSWFCGEDFITTDNLSLFLPDPKQNSETNACVVHFVTFLFHLLFSLVAIVTVIITTCISTSPKSTFLIRYRGHVYRYILNFVALFILSCAIAEGVLTDKTFQNSTHTQPQLYLPAICECVALIIALVYYQYSESNRRPRLCWLLWAYWTFSVLIQVLRLLLLRPIDIYVTRFWLETTILVSYVLFLIIESGVLHQQVSMITSYCKVIYHATALGNKILIQFCIIYTVIRRKGVSDII